MGGTPWEIEMIDRERILQHVWRAKDYADLREKDFNRVMDEITSLEELEAVANRRKHLRAPHLKKWSQWQRDAILRRQWELRHG
jgi:Skp family chaperone for outer membrane proteins